MEIMEEWQKMNDELRKVVELIRKVQQNQEIALKKLDDAIGYVSKNL